MLVGSAGNDTLNGDANDDFIDGNDGADTIDCGANTDVADGGAGIDSAATCETTFNVPLPARANGGGGIRTHEARVTRLAVFKTAPFDRSGTPPAGESSGG